MYIYIYIYIYGSNSPKREFTPFKWTKRSLKQVLNHHYFSNSYASKGSRPHPYNGLTLEKSLEPPKTHLGPFLTLPHKWP